MRTAPAGCPRDSTWGCIGDADAAVFGPKAPAKSPLGLFNPIGARPPQAAERSEPGHFEGDLILGSYNRSAIVTLFDRASRLCLHADLPEDHTACSVLAALVETFDRSECQHKLTLTWDRGVEMVEWDHLESLVGIDVFLSAPHSPWDRPTNENGNGLLRRYVGKGTDLGVYTPADLRVIETRLNTMPRRSLNWSTAQDIHTGRGAMTD